MCPSKHSLLNNLFNYISLDAFVIPRSIPNLPESPLPIAVETPVLAHAKGAIMHVHSLVILDLAHLVLS